MTDKGERWHTLDVETGFIKEATFQFLLRLWNVNVAQCRLELKVVHDDIATEEFLCNLRQALLLQAKVDQTRNVNVLELSIKVTVQEISLSKVEIDAVLVLA